MRINVAITGASGNMGKETLLQLMQSVCINKIRVLLLDDKYNTRYGKRIKRLYKDKLEIVKGNMGNFATCQELVRGMDYVVNIAAVIPPRSDKCPQKADECNNVGAKNIMDAISDIKDKQPKLIHISTVALYGHRNYLHPWGRIGDPLLPSVYDCYAIGKMRGERYLLESDIVKWVVLRQSAMLHNKMLADNLNDGLMFHTCLNGPLEWVTARDSGLLIKRIIERDVKEEIESFWKKCYNIGGGYDNRITGYDTFNDGFKLIGGSSEKFLKPSWHADRNFHGLWFADGDILNKLFDYQHDTMAIYWKEILNNHKFYLLAKLLPYRLISIFAIERLLKDNNAPKKWVDSDDKGKVKACFSDVTKCACDWKDYPLFSKGKISSGDIDFNEIRKIENVKALGYLLDHGYDESKADSELDIEDMKQAAVFRGGKCISETMEKGNLYQKLEWECHDGHRFFARPYTILKAGHWCPECCQPQPWDFDRLAKFMPFFAQVWYDSHEKNENCSYYFDKEYNAKFELYQE